MQAADVGSPMQAADSSVPKTVTSHESVDAPIASYVLNVIA